MVRKPLVIALLSALAIIAIGIWTFADWYNTELPVLETKVTQVFATKTGHFYKTATQSAIYSDKTATSDQAQRFVQQTQTQVSWYITATAVPTSTPTAGLYCQAEVISDGAYLYADPGVNPNPNSRSRLPLKGTVQIKGCLEDSEWLYIDSNGLKGFTQSFNLQKELFDCEPQSLGLHFMAGYLDDPDWRLVLEEQFAENSYIWYSRDGTQLTTSTSESEANLTVIAYGNQQEAFTEKLANKQFEAFEVIFNANVTRAGSAGYFGVKFFITDEGFKEIRFDPYYCTYSVYDGDKEIFAGSVNSSFCRGDLIFQTRFKIDEEQRLLVTVNGETQGPTEIPGLESKAGPISLTISDLRVSYNYLVVTAPKE